MIRTMIAFFLILAGLITFCFTVLDGVANGADLLGIILCIAGLALLWRKS